MRYLIVNYYRKANGQMDEVVSVSKRVKMRDLQSAAIILDFKTSSVLKSSVDGTVIPKDWHKIRNFYHQHYARIIDNLERSNAPVGQPEPASK